MKKLTLETQECLPCPFCGEQPVPGDMDTFVTRCAPWCPIGHRHIRRGQRTDEWNTRLGCPSEVVT